MPAEPDPLDKVGSGVHTWVYAESRGHDEKGDLRFAPIPVLKLKIAVSFGSKPDLVPVRLPAAPPARKRLALEREAHSTQTNGFCAVEAGEMFISHP